MKQTAKSLHLPAPVAAYFAADGNNEDAVAQCFTENAVVKDEGHTHKGRAAIKQWKTDASAKYQYTSAPFACEEKDGNIIVTSHVAGNFPGSPIDVQYSFNLAGSRITSLEITVP